MRVKTLILVLIILVSSCNSGDENTNLETNFVGEWRLVEMSGSFANSETTGTDMEWQETYNFNSDGTFQKTRETINGSFEAFGTYSVINNPNEQLLELNFNSDNAIIGNCSSDLKEYMVIASTNIFYASWNACDGPGLKYERLDK